MWYYGDGTDRNLFICRDPSNNRLFTKLETGPAAEPQDSRTSPALAMAELLIQATAYQVEVDVLDQLAVAQYTHK